MRPRQAHRLKQLLHREVVDQQQVDIGFQRGARLLQVFRLGHQRHPGLQGPCAGDGLADAAGRGDVVFLDQDAVVEADAMVDAAAEYHRVLLRIAQAGQGFARVDHLGAGAGHRIDIAAHRAGGAGKGLQEIQRGAFAGENGACRTPQRA